MPAPERPEGVDDVPDDVRVPDGARVPDGGPPDAPVPLPYDHVSGWSQRLGLAARGALIGAAEIVPGVSGGTVALVVGVYETIIRSAGHLVRALAIGARVVLRRGDAAHARAHLAQVRWAALVPIVVGMLAAIVVGARFLEPVLEDHPVQARALFAGLILASLVVPARMVGGRWTGREVLVGLLAAAVAFVLTGLPAAGEQTPTMPLVAISAAFAVCALVLPGVSGSFLLLTVGMYAPTLGAVNDGDLGYLGVFILGAVVGLGLFVVGLQWFLEHRRRITLVVMTGLMVGALRALWPWQDEDRHLLPVGDGAVSAVILVLAGAAVVTALIYLHERAVHAQRSGTKR